MTFRQSPDDPIPDDYGYVTVNGSQVWQLDLTQANNTRPNWVEVQVDLGAYAGQTVSLRLGVQNTGDNNGNMRVDYVKMVGGILRIRHAFTRCQLMKQQPPSISC